MALVNHDRQPTMLAGKRIGGTGAEVFAGVRRALKDSSKAEIRVDVLFSMTCGDGM
jgi:hypothetical protein